MSFCIASVGIIWIDLAGKIPAEPSDTITEIIKSQDITPQKCCVGDRALVSDMSVSEKGAITMHVHDGDVAQPYAVVTLTPLFINGEVSWRCSGEPLPDRWQFLPSTCR